MFTKEIRLSHLPILAAAEICVSLAAAQLPHRKMVAGNYQNSLPSRAALGAETPAGKDVRLRPSKNNAKLSPVKRGGNQNGSLPAGQSYITSTASIVNRGVSLNVSWTNGAPSQIRKPRSYVAGVRKRFWVLRQSKLRSRAEEAEWPHHGEPLRTQGTRSLIRE